jgi:hypothetical protein
MHRRTVLDRWPGEGFGLGQSRGKKHDETNQLPDEGIGQACERLICKVRLRTQFFST